MAYIGKQPVVGNFQVCDAISVVNGQAAYTMQVGSANVEPENANHMLVSLNGILQKPGSSFTISGATITFASNLATGDVIDFIILLGDTLNIGTPSDNAVTTASIAANAVTAAKFNADVISGQTELASEPADTDEFLVSDAGTLKRIDYSLIKGGGITEADQWRITADHTPGSSAAIISSNWERTDTDGFNKIGTGMTESSGIFTFPSTGFYLVEMNFWFSQLDSDYVVGYIYTTTDNSSYGEAATAVGSGGNTSKNNTGSTKFLFDVTNTSTHKVAFYALKPATYGLIKGNTATNQSSVTFIRLGDT
jgi:hypothetical protein